MEWRDNLFGVKNKRKEKKKRSNRSKVEQRRKDWTFEGGSILADRREDNEQIVKRRWGTFTMAKDSEHLINNTCSIL